MTRTILLLTLASLAAVTHQPRASSPVLMLRWQSRCRSSRSPTAMQEPFPAAPQPRAAQMLPSLKPVPALTLVVVNTNEVCYTNAPTAAMVNCFAASSRPKPLHWRLPDISFQCITNASNHSVAQVTHDLKTWQDVPASAFGYSNYNPALGSYLFGWTNRVTGQTNVVYLLVTNLNDMGFYRIAYRK